MADGKIEADAREQGDTGSEPRVNLAGIKRGPGRPRKDGTPAQSRNSRSTTPEPVDGADAEFLADAVVTVAEIGDEVLQNALLSRLAKAVPEKAEEFQQIQRQMRLGSKDTILIRKCVLRIAQKYALLSRFAPEILLLGLFAQYSVRQMRLIKFVEQVTIAAQKRPAVQAPANA